MFAITLLWRITYWIYVQDILSLSLGCGALLAWISLQAPIQWEHVFFFILAGLGALAILAWFILSVKI
jgi:hypothetical protein